MSLEALQNINPQSLLDTAISLAAAFVLGGMIGYERQYRQRTAGLRTNVLVAVGRRSSWTWPTTWPATMARCAWWPTWYPASVSGRRRDHARGRQCARPEHGGHAAGARRRSAHAPGRI